MTKWLGLVLAVGSGVLILFHLEDGQGGRQIRPTDDFGFVAGVIGFLIGSVWFLGSLVQEDRAKKLAAKHGFEVKQNTGQSAVAIRKADDHG